MNLKPCPFCGGEASTFYDVEEGYAARYARILINCKRCDASIRRSKRFIESGKTNPGLSFMEAEKDAAEAWNRRTE